MNREQLKKLISGTIVTLPTPMDDTFHVDMGRMAEMTRWWIDQGCGSGIVPLKVAAAMGEGPRPGRRRVAASAAHRREHRRPGVWHHLRHQAEGHDQDHRGRQEGSGPGSGRPADRSALLPSSQPGRLRALSSPTFSDAIDIGIMIYNTHWFGCESLTRRDHAAAGGQCRAGHGHQVGRARQHRL